MDRKLIDSIAAAWQEVVEKKRKEALDPVDDKENDKKFKNRKDKDIDNDGDVDSSDEFLHKRRKAIDNRKDGGEKPAKEEVEQDMDKDGMKKCPECGGSSENHDPECSKYAASEKKKASAEESCGKNHTKKESVSHDEWGYGEIIEETEDGFYSVYFEHGVEFNVPAEQLTRFEEGKTYAERSKGAAPTQSWKEIRKGKGANDMAQDHDADDPKLVKDDEEGHDDASKAGRATKLSKLRPGEKRVGHLNPEKPKDTTK
jgi:hypothetical protein